MKLTIDKIKSAIKNKNLQSLLISSTQQWVMLHLINDDIFFNSFLVDEKFFSDYQTNEVCDLSFSIPCGSVSCSVQLENGVKEYSISPCVEAGLNKSNMRPLYFYRSYYSHGEEHSGYEFLQEMIHALDLYWSKEKRAYCITNENGELEEKIFVENGECSLILIDKDTLSLYLGYSRQFLARFFEVTDMSGWNVDEAESGSGTLYLKKSEAGYARGCELFRDCRCIEEIECIEKKYETFIVQDIKHNKIIECSSKPDCLDSYYDDTGKPLEMSPVFFRSEVLSKYRNDPDKYRLNTRHLGCIGAWDLETYDVNPEGQVHTYIIYLSRLPYKEQKYWASYNEEPKGHVSARAMKTDFIGGYSEVISPLDTIKNIFSNFPVYKESGEKYDIWLPKEPLEVLFNQIQPVLSENKKEYKDFLINLSILVIDGFKESNIRKLIKKTSWEEVKDMRALQALESFLEEREVTCIKDILSPLRILHRERSKYSGHGGGTINFDIQKNSVCLAEKIATALKLLTNFLSKEG